MLAALVLALLAAAPAGGATLDDLVAGLNLVPLHGAAPAALALERLADGKMVALPALRGRPVIVLLLGHVVTVLREGVALAIEQVTVSTVRAASSCSP